MRFDTTARGWRLASSVGQGTGEHPDFVICDDPIEAKAAESDAERRAVIEWWDGTISTRGMMRDCRRVVIMQRLHENDLSGHILKRGGWDHICLPMEFEPNRMEPTSIGWSDWRTTEGELLWPQGMDREKVESKKQELGPWKAPGQLQQRPVRQGGGIIEVEKLKIVEALPVGCGISVRYWDKAATPGGGDYTAGVLMTESEGIFYVVDVVRGQWDYLVRNERIEQTAALDAGRFGQFNVGIFGEQEGGSGGKESAAITVRLLRGYSVRMEPVTGSKVNRAGPLAGQINAGNVRLLAGEWNQEFIAELGVFPVGDHDDQVDAAAGAYNKLCLQSGRSIRGRSPVIDLSRLDQIRHEEHEAQFKDETPSERFQRERNEWLTELAARFDDD